MKLDKIKFAKVIGSIERQHAISMTEDEIQRLDDIITFDLPEQQKAYPANHQIETLMALMAQGTRKIEAIKLHRQLTGFGLQDSKDAVERYWPKKYVFNKQDLTCRIGDYFRDRGVVASPGLAESLAELIVGMQE